jgi:hypothetical protein
VNEIFYIAESSNLLWCNAGPTSIAAQNSTFPKTLISNVVEPEWMSPVLAIFSNGQQFYTIPGGLSFLGGYF